nr:reverse transcriptase domain-containing protein [Tanacetum cinerariifolium]
MEEMMIPTTAFIRGEVAAASKKKGHVSWKPQDQSKRHTDKRPDFRGKLSHLIKEIKQGREQPKTRRKEEAAKDKPTTIYMVRSWQRIVKQKVTQSFEQGKEIAFLPLTTSNGTEGPLVIEAEIGRHIIHRMYIDGGSSMEILYEHCFNWLRPEIKSQIVPATTSLTGFSGETTWPLGQLRLLVTIGDATHSTKAWMNFMVVKSLSPYNGIIGRPRLKAIQAVPSTVHGMLKFPTEGGIVTTCSSLLIPAKCASIDTSFVTPREERTRPANFTVALHPNFPDQEVVVGESLSDRGRTELCSLLKKNLDIFTWKPSDMTRVPRSVAEHRLNIREGCPPVRQKKRGQAPERTKAIQAEVQKLVEARIMREVYYHDWLSNPVMGKKHDGSWRMLVDFTDLNKACPQDCYPLPEIDWKVESLCRYPFKCFLDAYKGYHQIQLAEADEEKTAFHTGQGVYCYTKMPFGLKNAGASQMGRNIEVYVDDLVVKSHIEAGMVRDIEETFRTLRKINMKLNPKNARSAEQAFQQLKQHLSDLPLLVAPRPQEELIMYLSATHGAISAVLMTEQGTSPDANLLYKPCITGSGTKLLIDGKTGFVTGLRSKKTLKIFSSISYHDGSSCVDGSGAGLILTNLEGVEFTYALRLQFAASNNEAEYKALVAGLRIATQIGMKNVQVNVDSKLVANQVLGTYVAKEDNIIKYLEIVKGLVSGFTTFSINQVPQSRNKKADALSKIASTSFAHLSKQEDGPTWMTELVDYLKEGTLPEDEKEVRKLRLKARQDELREGVLYKRSFLTPWLRCVGPLQAEYVMREIHEGSCSIHAGPQPLSGGVREGQIPDSRHGLLHKVNRSKGGGNDYRQADNGKQFTDNPFKDWFDKLNITQWFTSVKHPQSNGLVERVNRSLREVIPAEIEMPTYRTATVDVVNNDEEIRLNLDLLEERRELAAISEAKSKSKMMKYYNAMVRGVAFKPGDFVYRSNDASHAVAGEKLGLK